MFDRNKSVLAELLLIEAELRYRATPRANTLRGMVQQRLRFLAGPGIEGGDLEGANSASIDPQPEPVDPKAGEWLRIALAKLREKLIDLSKRNPLVSFKHSERGASYLRIIDELPDHLFETLRDGAMTFEPLPTTDETPKDELTHSFRIAWERARLTDAAYLAEMETLGEEVNDEAKVLVVEQALRTRVRAELGLPMLERVGKTIDIAALARAHGFDPSFELADDDDEGVARHRTDNKIRVLLTADRLDARLRTIHDRYRSHAAETGLHTLYVAFGFVEWFEDDNSKIPLHAPALILPVHLERRLDRSRHVFSLTARDEDPQINMAMRELLLQKFKLEAPKLRNEETPVSYFIRLAGVLEQEPRLRLSLRRFVTMAVLPFPRMVLWQDLDPDIWPDEALDRHPLLPQLLGAKDAEGGGDFLADYAIDDPAMAARVPPLVLDADVSQHSALIDVAEGRSLAIEGPPGTGKSQTITNIIGAAIDRGKRVLFVAEKQAALDVVAKRLRDVGFGPLLLQLHSDRATKTELLGEVRERLMAKSPGNLHELDGLRTELAEKRDLLRRYLALLHQPLGKLGRTAHHLIWRELRLRAQCAALPSALQGRTVEDADQIDALQLKRARDALANVTAKGAEITVLHGAVDRSPWRAARRLGAFNQEAELTGAHSAVEESDHLFAVFEELERHAALTLPTTETAALALAKAMMELPTPEGFSDRELHVVLVDSNAVQILLDHWRAWHRARDRAAEVHDRPLEVAEEDLVTLGALLTSRVELPATLAEARTRRAATDARIAALDRLETALQPMSNRFGLGVDASIEKVAMLCAAIDEVADTAPEISALRSEALLDERADILIEACRAEAEALAGRAGELGETLPLDTALAAEPTRLRELIDLIERTGFFKRLLSSTYRAGWREAARLFHAPPERENAVEILRKLGQLIEARRAFRDDCPARRLFGEASWRGVESDWASLTAAKALLDRVADQAALARFDAVAEIVATESLRGLRRHAQTVEAAGSDRALLGELDKNMSLRDVRDNAVTEREHLLPLIAAAEKAGVRDEAPLRTGTENCAEIIGRCQQAHSILAARPGEGDRWDWFKGVDTDLTPLDTAAGYAKSLRLNDVRSEIGKSLSDSVEPASLVGRMQYAGGVLTAALGQWRNSLEALCARIEAKPEEFLRRQSNEQITLQLARERLREAAADEEGLRLHADLGRYLAEAEEHDCRFVYDECVACGAATDCLADLYELLLARTLLRQFLHTDGAGLERLGGLGLTQARAQFAHIDDELQKVEARRIVGHRLANDRAPEGVNSGPRGTWTDLALLRHQIGLQKRHIPIRDLIHRAGDALAALKPVWMMSPTSAAQYIRPGSTQFDLVVIDEASQMRPEYAVGSIARGMQLIVVGDSNQLPPTDFFNVATPEAMDEEEDFTIDTESILDLANEKLPHKRALNWHYRSEHESLIQFSNRRFYQRRLVVFPSPTTDDPLLGVKHRHVKGLYESQINQPEAQAVIEEATGIMLTRPELSMGIATMNIKQRDLIWTEFERIAAQERAVQSYIERHASTIEPFFIKNLENVQGDERDVVLISTVYGPDVNGHVFQRFGPLNSKVGHRRLNVLITRAKQTTRLFTSLHPNDIKATDNTNEGVLATQAYVRYAAGAATTDDTAGGEPDSDFELFVAERLRGAGYEVVHQVGVEGFRIDLGVRHPSFPLGFIAGIECDGATFHSGLTVRDRDKIRQSVLEKLGWKIYRIWSTDWFANADAETTRLLTALEGWRDDAAASLAARYDGGDRVDDPECRNALDTPHLAPADEAGTGGEEPVSAPAVAANVVEAANEPEILEGPQGKHRRLDDIDWYEVMRGKLFRVWPDGDYAGEIEVLSRSSATPRLYGSTIAIQRSQYRGTLEATEETFIVDDLYVAVRRIAREARGLRAQYDSDHSSGLST